MGLGIGHGSFCFLQQSIINHEWPHIDGHRDPSVERHCAMLVVDKVEQAFPQTFQVITYDAA
jgi:hypothetical protein